MRNGEKESGKEIGEKQTEAGKVKAKVTGRSRFRASVD